MARYRFLPANAEMVDGALRSVAVLPWYALQEAVQAAKGGASHSSTPGRAYNPQLGNAAYHAV
jgi:hypothetical protein